MAPAGPIRRPWRRDHSAFSMRRFRLCAVLCLVPFLASGAAVAATRQIDVAATYGITRAGIAHAIEDAKRDFAVHPDDTVVLDFRPGVYDLSDVRDDRPVIDVSNIRPGDGGRLIIRGAGPDQTTLVMDKDARWIVGRNVYRMSFVGLHMTARQQTVSQGHVVATGRDIVVLRIANGFPSPSDIFNPHRDRGRYLRRYTDSRSDPQVIALDNRQIPWVGAEPVAGGLWRIDLAPGSGVPGYHTGDLVCIKSKPDGNAYWFLRGSDIAFDHVEWTRKSRGVFRGGIGKVRITNSTIDRGPPVAGQVPCLSTPEGGPQIGLPRNPPSNGDLVENNRFVATGDDAIAFFNASGIIRNNFVADSFARGILLNASPDVVLQNNEVLRSPILRKQGR
jgi:hypothetical protein